jgi:small basic protein
MKKKFTEKLFNLLEFVGDVIVAEVISIIVFGITLAIIMAALFALGIKTHPNTLLLCVFWQITATYWYCKERYGISIFWGI